MRITSGPWVILRDQALEVRKVDGRLHVAREPRRHDEWEPYVPPYDPYGPGAKVTDYAATSSPMTEDVIDDATPVIDDAGTRRA
jgi:hypothetical protein